ncbi:hypothetical protein RHMOL_Rhmol03G0126400 [Rhododendron molle]|uniref:Uncharacterized protein n=1 Tax=Rhododendron molle TaxID=49168 RepID=A0ACC0PET4_RHOML|nr:hypothetical protein RHMOL_Rhmol03G0126400 [Rhododendron molle]
MDSSFENTVNSSWRGSNLVEHIENFTYAAKNWNKNVFGNIFRKKRWIQGRLNGVHRAQENNFAHNLQLLESDLRKEYNEILLQEETLWFQKSRSKWITLGEKNTRYFHLSTIIRRRRSKITMLKDDSNIWIENPDVIKNHVQQFFSNLFQDRNPSQGCNQVVHPHPTFSKEDNDSLRLPLSDAEIWNSVKSINAYKSPGPDGIQAIFYHKFWHVVGPEVRKFVRECFQLSSIPEEMNKTFIALIPKKDNPDSIKMFRPISLCNVAYKVVTKIIVARLRPLLTKIISPFQSNFIPGRSTTDNIIITQEVLHTLRGKKGKNGGMIFKIDLEKAYDKVSWKFLFDTLNYFQLNANWIALIMSCVSSVQTSILWNGEPLPEFKPNRGLRQGDPLSPYLFVLCMERLSILINSKREEGSWKGIKVSRNSTPLTHLFFADDLILFGQDNMNTVKAMIDVLTDFCVMSGQTISLEKSKIFVSPNVQRNKARRISDFCGIKLTNDLGKYLGVPLMHKRMSKQDFNHIVDKVQNRLAGWVANTLMLAGRSTLVRHVSSTIPNYTMQTMHLPSSVCDRLDRINRNFLWGDTTGGKRMHLVKWDKVCKSKEGGGLGLKKAKDQNLASLTKLAWKVSNEEEGLWVSILRDKYLSNHSISSWPRRRPASHTWRSILDTKLVMDKGVKWIIGDGKSVSIWHDWWCGEKPLALSHPGSHTTSSQKVESLIIDGQWALGEIEQFLDMDSLAAINSISLPIYTQGPDHPSWVGSGNGQFTISAAYDIITKSDSDLRGWKWFWKCKIPEKFKTFIWLILHNSLPTNQLRVRRGIDTSELCPRCFTYSESISHLFRECTKAKEIWSTIPSSHLMRGSVETPVQEWVSHNLRCNKSLENGYDISWHILFVTSLWQIWKDRNKKSFDNIETPSWVSVRNIMAYSKEIVEAFKSPLIMGSQQTCLIYWVNPSAGNVKLNTDGCWYEMNGRGGFGGLFRDQNGDWIMGFYGMRHFSSSLEAEIWSIYTGLKIILDRKIKNVTIDSDSLTAVNLIKEGNPLNHPQSVLIHEAHFLMAQTDTLIEHTYRSANQCADHLARMGIEQMDELVFVMNMPISLREFALRDRLNIRQVLD